MERTEWKCPHCGHLNNQISVKCEDCGKFPFKSFVAGELHCAGCNTLILDLRAIEGKNTKIMSNQGTFLCENCQSIEEEDIIRPRKAVFIVSSGDHSDYHDDAVFSDKTIADKFVENYGGDVVTWELDPAERELKEGWMVFEIIMSMEGDTICCDERPYNKEAFFQAWDKVTDVSCIAYNDVIDSDKPMLHTFVIARDKMHAVKIANERRIKYKVGRIYVKGNRI